MKPHREKMKKTIILILVAFTALAQSPSAREPSARPLAAGYPAAGSPGTRRPPGPENPLGPLDGRNLHAPQLPWFSFPAVTAASPLQGTLRFKSGIYILNEFVGQYFSPSRYTLTNGRLSPSDQKELVLLDYESTVWEIGIEWQALRQLRFIGDWRLHFRYGGFMDGIIEGWHSLFRLPNAGRHFFDRDQSRWTIITQEGISISGGGDTVASGDLDGRLVYTLLTRPQFSLALQGGIKLPLGTGNFGSGHPDFGLSALIDWRPWTRWAFYAAAGFILPSDGRARPMLQFIPAVELRILKNLSLILQMNIQSSPITEKRIFRHKTFGRVQRFALPQTDLKIGLRGRAGRFDWQFYIEEDPLTWEGPDILLYFGAGWTIPPSRRPRIPKRTGPPRIRLIP